MGKGGGRQYSLSNIQEAAPLSLCESSAVYLSPILKIPFILSRMISAVRLGDAGDDFGFAAGGAGDALKILNGLFAAFALEGLVENGIEAD